MRCSIIYKNGWGGLGDLLLNELMDADLLDGRCLKKFAVESYPACGTPQEALCFHGLDGASLANHILGELDAPVPMKG